MDDFDWLQDKVERLAGIKQEIERLCKMGKHETYKKGLWAFWKLLIHAYYVDIFTNTAKKHYKNVVYIDLFAGPGFNYLKDIRLTVAGSPFIAHRAPRITKRGRSKKFDKMILVDLNKDFCASLNKIIVDATILCTDCNSDIVWTEIQHSLEPKKSIYLAFIDPEGTEIYWHTIERILRLKGDLIINYPWSGIARLVGSFSHVDKKVKAQKSIGDRLDMFFGDSTWRDAPEDSPADWLYNVYLRHLKKYRSEVVEFSITMTGGAQYRIIIAAARTRTGSPWLRPVRDLRNRLEKITNEQLQKLVEIYKGEQTQITDYF